MHLPALLVRHRLQNGCKHAQPAHCNSCIAACTPCHALACAEAPAGCAGRVLKTHGYYDKRPAQTLKYGEFDQRTWTAHIGMGNETVGSAIAGVPSSGGCIGDRACLQMCAGVWLRARELHGLIRHAAEPCQGATS